MNLGGIRKAQGAVNKFDELAVSKKSTGFDNKQWIAV
jgi:hypothetical protein